MNIQLADITTLTLSTFIPRLDDPEHLDALDRFIREIGAEVIAIDPTYLAMCGSDAGNPMSQGERLTRVNEICQRRNAGLILRIIIPKHLDGRISTNRPTLTISHGQGMRNGHGNGFCLGDRRSMCPAPESINSG